MKHFMRLQNRYFAMIRDYLKTIELRLFDEKRRKINIGDKIEFLNIDTDESLLTVVVDIITAASFDELCSIIDIKQTGFADKISLLKEINNIYSVEKTRLYGVMAIKIKIADKQ